MTTSGAGRTSAVPTRIQPGAVAALATSSFVYVTAETMPVGLLPQIAHGLSVSEADVGLLLTSYAGLAAATTIPLTALTMRVPRHRLIVMLVAIFVLSQGAAAFAPTFSVLIITRLFSALAHGVFWSALAPVAQRLAPPEQTGRVTSLVFVGNSTALVLGVPLTTALGQWAGWRVAFGAVALAGAVSMTALMFVLPSMSALPADLAASTRTRLARATATIRSRALAPVCARTTVLVIGQFAAYTYIAPIVRHSGGVDGVALSALLFGYGAAGVFGNLLGGRAVDRYPGAMLIGSVLSVAIALTTLTFVHTTVGTTIAVLLWGAGFSVVPVSLQTAALHATPAGKDAGSAVYVVAFQIGIGSGALVGDRLDGSGHLSTLPIFAALIAAVCAVFVLSSRRTFPLRLADDSAARGPAPAQ